MSKTDEKTRLTHQGMFQAITPGVCAHVVVYLHTYYMSERTSRCSLCGDFGVVDTRGRVLDPEGRDQGRLQWCFCPYGQSYRDGAEGSGITDSTSLMEDLYRGQHDPSYRFDFYGKLREIALKQKKARDTAESGEG
jgi:hypothetical protein